jgi:hypothetical protein
MTGRLERPTSMSVTGSAYATLRGPVVDSDERLQRHDPEDGVVRGDLLERLDRLEPVDGDVRPASRHRLDVPPDHRRPRLHWHLEEPDRTRPASPQGGATSCGTHVPDPIAFAEHRDEVPLALEVRHAEGEPSDHSGTSTAYLARDPALRQKADAKRHVPEPRVPSGRRVARPPTYIARSLSYCRPLTINLSHVGALHPRLATAWEPSR